MPDDTLNADTEPDEATAPGPEPPPGSATAEAPDPMDRVRRQRRQIRAMQHRRRSPSSTTQWIFVGIALLFLLTYFIGRDSCARRFAQSYGKFNGDKTVPRPDAGVTPPPPPPPKPDADPDDW